VSLYNELNQCFPVKRGGQAVKKVFGSVAMAGALSLLAVPAQAIPITFQAVLTGAEEVPAVMTPATGLATVILDETETMLTISATFSGLLAPQTAAHIHGLAPPGVNAPVRIPMGSFPLGELMNLVVPIPDPLPGTPFLTRAEFVEGLKAGLTYFNIHTTAFPGGEIRGQLLPVQVPEPATLALMATGLGILAVRRGRRK
jgi:hypothetical protein